MNDRFLKSLLGDNEQVLFVTHKHWLVLAGEIVSETFLSIGVIVLVTLIYLLWVPTPLVLLGYLLLVFPLVSLARDVLIWSGRKYVVTNRRVMQLAGVFNKNVTDSSLEKVNDVKLSQSFMGRVFGYGDIEILTASELGANKFTYMGRPIQYKTAMINAKEKLERSPVQVVESHPAPTPEDLLGQLEILRQHGVVSEEEFQSKKTELLKKM